VQDFHGLLVPPAFLYSGEFDDKHADEVAHLVAQEGYGFQASYFYITEKFRFRASGTTLIAEGKGTSAWVVLTSWTI
jgi:hypothetical protein